MTLEVVIPEMRPQHVDNILHSFNVTGAPDLITFVSNLELPIRVPKPCPVRQLRYTSDRYSTGKFTVSLKRNIGAWWAQHENVMFFDDDQLASHEMLWHMQDLLDDEPVVYGHHRFVDYNAHTVDDILKMVPGAQQSREEYIGFHTWESGYAGLMGFKRDYYIALGGTDMWWSNVPSHEDQDFARRHLLERGRDRIEIHEPPFAWHPLWGAQHRLPITSEPSNTCDVHTIVTKKLHNLDYQSCIVCPWHASARVPMYNKVPLMPFNSTWVDVTETWL